MNASESPDLTPKLLYEYVLDPDCSANYTSFSAIWKEIGGAKGRLLTVFPEEWAKLIFCRVTAGLRETDPRRLKLKEELLNLDTSRRLYRRRQIAYDSGRVWLDNAIQENDQRPFRAIVCSKPPHSKGKAAFMGVDDAVAGDHELWQVQNSLKIDSTSSALAESLVPILARSTTLTFIDPYLLRTRNWKPILAVTKRFLELTAHLKTRNIVFHAGDIPDQTGDLIDPTNVIKDVAVAGVNSEFNVWGRLHGGPGFNDRFLITDHVFLSVQHEFRERGPKDKYTLTRLEHEPKELESIRENKYRRLYPRKPGM